MAASKFVRPRLGAWVTCGLCGWETKYGTGRLFRDWFGLNDLYTCLYCKEQALVTTTLEQATALLMAAALGGVVDE